MSLFGCNNCKKCSCVIAAIISSILLGILTAFLQISGVVTITTTFLWVALGIAVVYLGVLTLSSALASRNDQYNCLCDALEATLTGILGTVLFSVVLLAIGIVATSILSAVLAGLTVGFLALTLTSTACLVRYLTNCGN